MCPEQMPASQQTLRIHMIYIYIYTNNYIYILSCILIGELKWHWNELVHKTRVKIVKEPRNLICNVALHTIIIIIKRGLYRSCLHCFCHYSTRRRCDFPSILFLNKYVKTPRPDKLASANTYVACCAAIEHVASDITKIFGCRKNGEVAWRKQLLYTPPLRSFLIVSLAQDLTKQYGIDPPKVHIDQ